MKPRFVRACPNNINDQNKVMDEFQSRNRATIFLIGALLVVIISVISIRAYVDGDWSSAAAPADEKQTLGLPKEVLRILDDFDSLELMRVSEEAHKYDDFHSWRFGKQVLIDPPQQREQILAALRWGIEHADPGVIPCAEPEYAIRLTSENDSAAFILDSCGRAQVYFNDRRVTTVEMSLERFEVFGKILSDKAIEDYRKAQAEELRKLNSESEP